MIIKLYTAVIELIKREHGMFQNKNAVKNHQTIHIYVNMSCCFVLLMMNNEYFVWFMVFKSYL